MNINSNMMQICFIRWNIIQEMKSKSFNDQQTISVNMYQSGQVHQYMPSRPSNLSRDYSNDQKMRRISPIPQERFSQFSANLIYPIPSYPPNQYQLPLRTNEHSMTTIDSKRSMQDLIARIQKLEHRSQRNEKLEFRMQKLESSFAKFQLRMENLENRGEQFPQGNQNRMNLQNCAGKNQEQMKQRMKNLITRQELQRQLIGLDSAFKTLIKEMKSNTNLQMREIHTKQKKAMIQVVASQISQKLETFKSNFISQLSSKIQQAVKQNFNKDFSQNIIGATRQKFVGTSLPLKLTEQLHYISNGVEKSLTIAETSYFIDSQGYLLDSNLIYLLDKSNSRIKLSESHLDVLKREGLLSYTKEVYKSMKDTASINFNEK